MASICTTRHCLLTSSQYSSEQREPTEACSLLRAIAIGSDGNHTTINVTSESTMLQVSGASGLSAVGVRLTDGAWNGQQLSLFAGASKVKFDSTAENLHFASGGNDVQLCSGDCCLLSITLVWLDTASRWMETSRAPEKCSATKNELCSHALKRVELRSRLEELRQLEADGLITVDEGAAARRLALGLVVKT